MSVFDIGVLVFIAVAVALAAWWWCAYAAKRKCRRMLGRGYAAFRERDFVLGWIGANQ